MALACRARLENACDPAAAPGVAWPMPGLSGRGWCVLQTDDMNRIISAISFAADKHRNQRRKDIEASPYINHPIALANILANEASIEDEKALVAAILHDTIEDTETTAAELADLFGDDVTAIVL